VRGDNPTIRFRKTRSDLTIFITRDPIGSALARIAATRAPGSSSARAAIYLFYLARTAPAAYRQDLLSAAYALKAMAERGIEVVDVETVTRRLRELCMSPWTSKPGARRGDEERARLPLE